MINTHRTISITETLDIVPTPKKWASKLLNWLISKDQAYKQELHLKTLSKETLKDVGLTR